MLGVREELLIMNAYFIPGQATIDWFNENEERGVRVAILTNSLAFVVDRELVYVGSHNLDPRSHEINLELGPLVENPSLAEELAAVIEESFSGENSWRVLLDAKGKLYWQAGDERVKKQPARHFWQRVENGFYGLFPIEDQL